jgi:hypothetical protein
MKHFQKAVVMLLAMAPVVALTSPPDFSSVAEQRHRWRAVRDKALGASPVDRRAAISRLLEESLKQSHELKTLQVRRVKKPEHLVAPFCLLPVLLEFAEELAAADGTSWDVAYRVALARRALNNAWRLRPPTEYSPISLYRRWARDLQDTLPDVIRHLDLAGPKAAGPAYMLGSSWSVGRLSNVVETPSSATTSYTYDDAG